MKLNRAFRIFGVIVICCMILGAVPQKTAKAWDSMVSFGSEGENSHYIWVEDAIDELIAEDPAYNGLDRLALQQGAEGESMHPHKRNLQLAGTPDDYIELAVGNNGGTNYPEYYWQSAIYHYRQYVLGGKSDPKIKEEAYRDLGLLLHILEDSSSPPHVYSVLHGAAYLPYRQDLIEYLSAWVALESALAEGIFGGHYPYGYYMHPDSPLQPGKNVLDAMRHLDDAYVVHTLRQNIQNWTVLFSTNLQAPAPRKVKVYTQYSGLDPSAHPVFYLRFSYFNAAGQWVTQESGQMCTSIDHIFNAPCTGTPRTFEWSASFAANTGLVVEYRRPEGGAFAVDRDVSFKVYVEETENVVSGMVDPQLNNPWEYSDWLQKWTTGYAASAPFWQRYWTRLGDYGDLSFNADWYSAPNSERAFLTMLGHATKEVAKWTLRSAFRQFQALEGNGNAITDEDALGEYSYRVAFFADTYYNSASTAGEDGGSPEYLRSLSFTCTPYEKRPCQGWKYEFTNIYPWMNGMISSVTVRNAVVVLHNASGGTLWIYEDTPDLGSFNDQTVAVSIMPAYPEKPLTITPAMTAGNSHTCRLQGDGMVKCWGYNVGGISTPPNESFAFISAGASHSCGVRFDRTVRCWGLDYYGETTPPPGENSFIEVSAGTNFTCGRRSNETVVCWGDSRWNLTAAPPGYFFSQISSGTYHSCGVRTNGLVACWGNYTGELTPPDGTFRKVSVGDNYACGIRMNGTIACWSPQGVPASGPIFENIPTGLFAQLDAGISHACAIRSQGGTLACWGDSTGGKTTPPSGDFLQIGVGHYHSCALRGDEFMQCWGSNGSGQAPVLSLGPASLSDGIYLHPYTAIITTSGGRSPYYYGVQSGLIPPGITLEENGALTGAPSSTGTYVFTIRSIDSNYFVNSKTYSLRINPNRAPVAQADTAFCVPGSSVLIDAVRNDYDPDSDWLSLLDLAEPPAHGTVEIGKGRIEYFPGKGFVGTDEFVYSVSDPYGGVGYGTVTIVVDYKHVYIPLARR